MKIGNLDISSFKVGGADCSIYLGDTKLYPNEPPTPHDYSQDYFTISAIDNIKVRFSGTSTSNKLEYSTDSGSTWTAISIYSYTPVIAGGSKVLFRGNVESTLSGGQFIGPGCFMTSGGTFNVEGNIMSLCENSDFINKKSLVDTYTGSFKYLFSGNTNIISAENLSLPATTIINECYSNMFYGCTSLTTAPSVLPAATLSGSCYSSMFEGCTSLTTAPELPSTNFGSAEYCYRQMFSNCTSLTTAPELPATKLANGCYSSMFKGCASLTTAPELPATTLKSQCYQSMFSGCTSLTTTPELPATTLSTYCYNGMFLGCTSLTTAPVLSATTLAKSCYYSMFNGCTSLNAITCLATNISASNCLKNWVSGVAASGTFTKAASMSSWTTGNNGIPSGWSVQNYS